jgi:hypothetical protein
MKASSREYSGRIQIWETIESRGPGELYTLSDGITRFRRRGPVTSTLTRLVSVTSSTMFVAADPAATYPPWETYQLRKPACQFPKHERVCLPNATDAAELRIHIDQHNSVFITGGCVSVAPECRVVFAHDEVVLFFWPPNVSTVKHGLNQTLSPASGEDSHSSRRIVVTPAVTFRGQDLYHDSVTTLGGPDFHFHKTYITRSTMKGPFTFTSPTIYLAHHPMTFGYTNEVEPRSYSEANWSVRPAGVIGLKSADVSSVVPLHPTYNNDTEYASLVANGKFKAPPTKMWTTLPVNFADLQDPVPARQYFDARWEDCWGEQTHCGTITDDSYRPQLVIASSVWGTVSDPIYGKCFMPLLVDPPLALSAITDGSPEENFSPLPPIQRDPGRVDWNLAASATATVGDAPGRTGLPLEPRPIPTRPWPLPTATSRSTPWNVTGTNKAAEKSHNGAAVFTSGSHALNQEFVVDKWIISLALSLLCVIVIGL